MPQQQPQMVDPFGPVWPANPVPVFRMYGIPQETQPKYNSVRPNILFLPGETARKPFSRYYRQYLERLALHKIALEKPGGMVMDLGGCLRTHKLAIALGLRYHACRPNSTPTDLVEQGTLGDLPHCNCWGEYCNHVQPDAILSIHSLYYFSRTSLMLLMKRHLCDCYAVHFAFNRHVGTIPSVELQESWYTNDGDMIEHHGGLSHLRHPSLDWMFDGCTAMAAWDEVEGAGGLSLTKFVPTGANFFVNPRICPTIRPLDYHGTDGVRVKSTGVLVRSQRRIHFDRCRVPMFIAPHIPTFLWGLCGIEKRLHVVELDEEAKLLDLGRERTTLNYRSLQIRTTAVATRMAIPADLLNEVVVSAVRTAMEEYPDTEIVDEYVARPSRQTQGNDHSSYWRLAKSQLASLVTFLLLAALVVVTAEVAVGVVADGYTTLSEFTTFPVADAYDPNGATWDERMFGDDFSNPKHWFKTNALDLHPDKGGTDSQFILLQQDYEKLTRGWIPRPSRPPIPRARRTPLGGEPDWNDDGPEEDFQPPPAAKPSEYSDTLPDWVVDWVEYLLYWQRVYVEFCRRNPEVAVCMCVHLLLYSGFVRWLRRWAIKTKAWYHPIRLVCKVVAVWVQLELIGFRLVLSGSCGPLALLLLGLPFAVAGDIPSTPQVAACLVCAISTLVCAHHAFAEPIRCPRRIRTRWYRSEVDPLCLPLPALGRFEWHADSPRKHYMTHAPLVCVDGRIPHMPANSSNNWAASMLMRHFQGTEHNQMGPMRDQTMLDRVFHEGFDSAGILPYRPGSLDPLPVEAWLATIVRKDDQRRIRMLMTAHENNLRCTRPIRMQVRPFVKREFYPESADTLKPRSIANVNDEYLVSHGPVAARIGDRMKRVFNKHGPVYYTSGASQRELGDYYRAALEDFGPGCTIVENDFSRFESTIGTELLECEFRGYVERFGMDPRDLNIFRQQLEQRIYSRYGFTGYRKGGRASGVANTSCGNSYINVALHCAALRRFLVPHRSLYDQMRMMVLGDDNILVLHPDLAQRVDWQEYEHTFQHIGMVPELKLHEGTNYAQAEYCSGFFGPTTSGEWSWCPKPGRLLVKGYFVDTLLRNPYAVARGQMLGLLAGTLDPINSVICETMANRMENLGSVDSIGQRIIGDRRLTMSYEALSNRYGVTPTEVHECAVFLAVAASTSWPLNIDTSHYPVLEAIVGHDCPLVFKGRNILPGFNDSWDDPLPVSLAETRIHCPPELAKQPRGSASTPGSRVDLGLIYGIMAAQADPEAIRATYCTQYRELTSLHY
jgi:hypothetical protein